MKKKKQKKIIIISVIIGIILIAYFGFKPLSISPYCKSLPENAVNTLSLNNDINGCPHWYLEIKTVAERCCCLYGTDRMCGADLAGWSGCLAPGASWSQWVDCSQFSYNPISDYGGLLEGYDCTKDLTKTCSDGSEIIEKSCVDGNYVATNNNCNENNPNNSYIIIFVILAIAGGLYYYFKKIK